MKSFGCMPAVRTPEASRTLTVSCPGILPSPLRDKVGAFHHDRFRGYVSVHFRSGLHPPCLRFAVAVAGHHARLGTRLLVRLCRGRHRRRLNSMRLQGATLTDPDLNLSIHPARVTARRLPPSAEPSGSSRFDPVGPCSTAMTCPLCSTGITPLHHYYGAVRPSPAHRYFRPHGWSRLCLSLSIAGQVLTFHTRARLSFAPPTCRMPLGQSQCIPQADPGRRVNPRFWHRLIRFRHFIDGSLALASLNRACRDHVPTFPQRCRVGPGSFTPSRSQIRT